MTIIRRMRLHARHIRLQIHTLNLCKTYSFSTATMVARTHFNVTFINKLALLFLMTANDSLSEILCFVLVNKPGTTNKIWKVNNSK